VIGNGQKEDVTHHEDWLGNGVQDMAQKGLVPVHEPTSAVRDAAHSIKGPLSRRQLLFKA
jgi:hypothetical protein